MSELKDGECDWTAVMIFQSECSLAKVEEALTRRDLTPMMRSEGEAHRQRLQRHIADLREILHLATVAEATRRAILDRFRAEGVLSA